MTEFPVPSTKAEEQQTKTTQLEMGFPFCGLFFSFFLYAPPVLGHTQAHEEGGKKAARPRVMAYHRTADTQQCQTTSV